ncbi:MAG: ACT domain-containing protein [Candidatus Thorarchaeota archaeon]|nr:ACT domain-containing protein [Candidatus Thorarchaeota archaeon]
MAGESNLATLLKMMNPILQDELYVFVTSKDDSLEKMGLSPIMTFNEHEGRTRIVSKKAADRHNLRYASVWKLITLAVHSNLEAVGFIAIVTTELAKAGISTNAVSAYYHDHIFVPESRAKEALQVLTSLCERQH